MATSKKTTPQDKPSDKKATKVKASEEIKKPVKAVKSEKEAAKLAPKAKPVFKDKPDSKEKKTAEKSKGRADKASGKAISKAGTEVSKPVAHKEEIKANKAKSAKAIDAKSDEKIKKVKEVIEEKGKKSAEANPNAKAPKRPTVAVFTLDNVREILQSRRDEEREQAKKEEAAAKKAATNIIIPETPQNRVLGAATLADILGFGFAAAKKTEPLGAGDAVTRAVPDQHRKYYDMLVSLRDRIQKKINHRSHADKTIGEETPVAVPAQTDEDDSFDHDFALSLVANEQEALMEINAAIDRIFDGTYGICEITGRQISAERLDAVPFARYSVEGQAQYEMQNRRRSQRSAAFPDASEEAGIYSGEDADE
jgi:RNA polymerase-binding transcription factor DksA